MFYGNVNCTSKAKPSDKLRSTQIDNKQKNSTNLLQRAPLFSYYQHYFQPLNPPTCPSFVPNVGYTNQKTCHDPFSKPMLAVVIFTTHLTTENLFSLPSRLTPVSKPIHYLIKSPQLHPHSPALTFIFSEITSSVKLLVTAVQINLRSFLGFFRSYHK